MLSKYVLFKKGTYTKGRVSGHPPGSATVGGRFDAWPRHLRMAFHLSEVGK